MNGLGDRGRILAAWGVCAGLTLAALIAASVAASYDLEFVLLIIGPALTLLAMLGAATVLGIIEVSQADHPTRRRALVAFGWIISTVTALWLSLIVLTPIVSNWHASLWCIPSTAFAVWAYRRTQRNLRAPVWTSLAALAWGALVAGYFSITLEAAAAFVIDDHTVPGLGAVIAHAFRASVTEEIGKSAGVLVIFLLARRWMNDVINGIVIGAIIGLGFQFFESIQYIEGVTSRMLYQYWYRQVGGLFLNHATYTAIVGAAFGLASRQTGSARKVLCALSGLTAAIAGHLVWDICAGGQFYWASDTPEVDLFVMLPLNLLVLKGPLTLAVLILIGIGARAQSQRLGASLMSEAYSGDGSVLPNEVASLVYPRLRLMLRLRTVRRGAEACRNLLRLQNAQIELALLRPELLHETASHPSGQREALLRAQIRHLRGI